jgi:hypothetical protein
MAEESWPEKDLWGEPGKAPADPRGRKRHRRLPQIAEKVAVLRAADVPVEMIATRVGLSEPTLRKYYFRELDKGADLAKAVIIETLFEKGKGGNITAARAFLQHAEKSDTTPRPSRGKRGAAPAEPKLGKKEEANLAAQTAHQGTGWDDLIKH